MLSRTVHVQSICTTRITSSIENAYLGSHRSHQHFTPLGNPCPSRPGNVSRLIADQDESIAPVQHPWASRTRITCRQVLSSLPHNTLAGALPSGGPRPFGPGLSTLTAYPAATTAALRRIALKESLSVVEEGLSEAGQLKYLPLELHYARLQNLL